MFKLIPILISVLFITSCATTAPVLNKNTPLHIYGVSSLSPTNGNWKVITTSGYQVALGEKSHESDTSVINMSIHQIEDFESDNAFLESVIKQRASAPDIGRFELQKNSEKLIPLNGAVCVKYNTISQDSSAKIKGNESAVMLIEYIGYHCIHPNKKSVGVHMEYSLRHFSDTEYPALNIKADEFFSNVKFTAF